jgi:hypothetical protein
MVDCPICNLHVGYTFLRTEHPKCPGDHSLGTWVYCQNEGESHIFLQSKPKEKCPACGSESAFSMKEGMRVKCLHVTNEGLACTARPYIWIREGPPCFMNHIAKMKVVKPDASNVQHGKEIVEKTTN